MASRARWHHGAAPASPDAPPGVRDPRPRRPPRSAMMPARRRRNALPGVEGFRFLTSDTGRTRLPPTRALHVTTTRWCWEGHGVFSPGEHHLFPSSGMRTWHIPKGRVIGLSQIPIRVAAFPRGSGADGAGDREARQDHIHPSGGVASRPCTCISCAGGEATRAVTSCSWAPSATSATARSLPSSQKRSAIRSAVSLA